MRKFWGSLGRFWFLIFLAGMGLGALFWEVRNSITLFFYLWFFISLAITYILFFLFSSADNRDMDGDF